MNATVQHQIWQIQRLLKDPYLSLSRRIVFTRKLKALEASNG